MPVVCIMQEELFVAGIDVTLTYVVLWVCTYSAATKAVIRPTDQLLLTNHAPPLIHTKSGSVGVVSTVARRYTMPSTDAMAIVSFGWPEVILRSVASKCLYPFDRTVIANVDVRPSILTICSLHVIITVSKV